MPLPKSGIGVAVQMCGHKVVLPADFIQVSGAVVVRIACIKRKWHEISDSLQLEPDYHLVDFPIAGYWDDVRCIYVVPKNQLLVVKGKQNGEENSTRTRTAKKR